MKKYYYLIELSFFGFRFHGWQFQKGGPKTIQEMLNKAIEKIFERNDFKTLGGSRTDSMVSAQKFRCQLTTTFELDPEDTKYQLNKVLSQDIRVKSISASSKDFSVISNNKTKEYHYYFCNTQEFNPYASGFMVNFFEPLNIEIMKEGAKLFEGTHYFERYSYKPNEFKEFVRTINKCEIVENTFLQASFFPEKSYTLRLIAPGFLRHQVRMIMGGLFKLGSGQTDIMKMKASLSQKTLDNSYYPFVANANGLHLVDFDYN